MQIKLIQKGGFIPKTKEAVTEADLTEEELKQLLEEMAPDMEKKARIRDGDHFFIETAGHQAVVDLSKVPEKHQQLFEWLRENLKFIPIK